LVATAYDEALAYCLALDACDLWKLENGYKMLSVDDLVAVKKWLSIPRATIWKFPELQALAARGIDELIPRCSQVSLVGGKRTACP
jgi:hypothetical protein